MVLWIPNGIRSEKEWKRNKESHSNQDDPFIGDGAMRTQIRMQTHAQIEFQCHKRRV